MSNSLTLTFLSHMRSVVVGLSLALSLVHASEMPALDIDPIQARHAVQKVKAILQAIQAREQDYAAAFEKFMVKFENPDSCPIETLDIIAPVWTNLYNNRIKEKRDEGNAKQKQIKSQIISNSKGNNQHAIQQKTLKEKRNQLVQQLIAKKSVIKIAHNDFQKDFQRSKNVVGGVQKLIDGCDEYLDSPETTTSKKLPWLLDSLLCSHLLGLKNVIDRYMSAESTHGHLSFNREEINTYYTQDLRIPALSEVHYIEDLMRPIGILMKLGLKMESTDWDFAEKLKLYVQKELTLDDPSVFLLDGYFFKKGLEKNQKSQLSLEIIKTLITQTDTDTAFDSSIIEAVPLTHEEKEHARKEFTGLFQAHQQRAKDYIKNLTTKDLNNIHKSSIFLVTALEEASAFHPTTLRNKIDMFKEEEQREKKSVTHKKKASPHLKIKAMPEPLQEPTTTSTTTTLKTASASEQLLEEEKPLADKRKAMAESKDISYPVFKEKKQSTTRATINTSSQKVLHKLLDPTASPFTIDYIEALNAMSKIGIMELKSKRHGDFRKLVRVDNNGQVIGKIFAYRPATPTLGYELMRTYRTFIHQQLTDRPELNFAGDRF